MFEASKPVVLS